MKKTLISFVAILLLSSIAFAGGGKKYGKSLTLKKTTKISAILENPKDFVGKKVLIEGMIVDVCEKRGCWMELAGDKEFQKIRIKVEDGVIVFPMEAKGKKAKAEGTVEEIVQTKEQALAYAEHHAEEHGTTFDPSTITEGKTTYRIRGLGAVIK